MLSYSLAARAASLVLNSTQAFFCPAAADRRTATTSPQAVKNSAIACEAQGIQGVSSEESSNDTTQQERLFSAQQVCRKGPGMSVNLPHVATISNTLPLRWEAL